MKKTKALQDLGLSEIAAHIYTYLLEHKRVTVLEIARGTGVARTNVYYNMNQLKDAGLVGEAIEGRKKYFVPESPSNLITMIQKKKDLALDIAGILEEDFKKNKYESKIRFGYGKEDFKKFSQELLESKEKITRQFIDFEALANYGDPIFLKKFWKERADKKIKAKIICSNRSFKKIKKEMIHTPVENIKKLRELRYLPEGVNFQLSLAVFDNKVHFFAPPSEGYIFSFESPAFADTIKRLHDLLWKISTEKPIK